MSEAFTVLKDVPIEELSKDRAGLRVKALHDYGFHNLSDIYAATTTNISQVRGISWETAYAVKQYAIDYLKKAQESVKRFMDSLKEEWEELPPYFVTSSEKRTGRDELLAYIDNINKDIAQP